MGERRFQLKEIFERYHTKYFWGDKWTCQLNNCPIANDKKIVFWFLNANPDSFDDRFFAF